MRSAISFCFGVSLAGSVANQWQASRIDMSDTRPICRPSIFDRERLRLEAIAGAGLARLVGLEARQLLAHPGGFGLAPAPLDIGDHALEGLGGRVMAHAVVICEGDLVVAGAVEDDVAEVFGERLPRLGHGLAVGARERLQRLLVIGRGGAGARPGGDGAAVEAQFSSGTTRSASKNSSVPSPSQAGQAP